MKLSIVPGFATCTQKYCHNPKIKKKKYCEKPERIVILTLLAMSVPAVGFWLYCSKAGEIIHIGVFHANSLQSLPWTIKIALVFEPYAEPGMHMCTEKSLHRHEINFTPRREEDRGVFLKKLFSIWVVPGIVLSTSALVMYLLRQSVSLLDCSCGFQIL